MNIGKKFIKHKLHFLCSDYTYFCKQLFRKQPVLESFRILYQVLYSILNLKLFEIFVSKIVLKSRP